MNQNGSDKLELVRRRLFGSGNRIHWQPRDIARIEAHLGGSSGFSAPLFSPPKYIAPPMPLRAPAVKSVGNSRTFNFTISTSSVDRMGDRIAVDGWKLDNYRK